MSNNSTKQHAVGRGDPAGDQQERAPAVDKLMVRIVEFCSVMGI